MQFFQKSIFLFLLLTCPQILFALHVNENYVSKWGGVEVVGTDQASAEKIRKLNLITIGTPFLASKAKYYCKECQKNIQKKTQFKNAYCSLVWYGDERAYLVVETEGTQADNISFRSIPIANQDANF